VLELVEAHFQNYRLLRDTGVVFSTRSERPLTVIRAENESGKTTLLTALQWAFFGDDALPTLAGGQHYRLHPLDWDTGRHGRRVEIRAEVTFRFRSVTTTPTGGEQEREDEYVLQRIAEEQLGEGNAFDRFTRQPTLLHRTHAGYTPIETNPKVLIDSMIPYSLKDVFFTDGDRALAFIEASQDAKRERVRDAIRSLLGLELVEAAQKHVVKALSDMRRAKSAAQGGDDYDRLTNELNGLDDEIEAAGARKTAARSAQARLEAEIVVYNERLERALVKGDREALSQQLRRAQDDREAADHRVAAATRDFAALFRDSALALNLLAPVISRAHALLQPLHAQGRIPSTFIPLLQERLKSGVCICGRSLADGTSEHRHVLDQLVGRQLEDEANDRLGQLFYRAETFIDMLSNPGDRWVAQLRMRSAGVDDARRQRKRAEETIRETQLMLGQVPDVDVVELRRQIKDATEQLTKQAQEAVLAEAEIIRLSKQKTEVEREREHILKSRRELSRQRANERAASDLLAVLNGTVDVLRGEKLSTVSNEMNRLFLDMIVADPDQNSIIQKAHITPDYDIIVTGSRDRRLDPDVDLNGASRRALTIAFILALTKVSETAAPNIIDTPLGMTAGQVKRSILEAAVRESTQLVLLLTRDEIHRTEDLLDEYAGSACTFSNTAHYPLQLVNAPPFNDQRVMACLCNHRQFCRICERLHDATEGTLLQRMDPVR
jgi:DNA sulfur modification protein DndD